MIFYDIRNETKKDFILNQENKLLKYFLYKIDCEKDLDCDSCLYSKKIYKQLWNFETGNGTNFGYIELNKQNDIYGIDTMNSFLISWNWFVKNYIKEEIVKIFGNINFKKVDINMFIYNFFYLEDIIIKKFGYDLYENIYDFAKYTHTIGNFILVPKYIEGYTKGKGTFNTIRASKEKDFWDLSLSVLKNSDFSFNEYCDKFYLKNIYVDADCAVIPLFNRSHNVLFDSIEDYNVFLSNVNKKIIKRNMVIQERLGLV